MSLPQKLEMRRQLDRTFARGPLPAPVCASDCDEFDPATGCQRDCTAALRHLSSDPANHPLEPRIAPLVFELKKLGVFHPCWSCEGHNDASGTLWKIPRIWFSADSTAHLRVLSQTLNATPLHRRLSTAWHVVVTSLDTTHAETIYSLEPGLDPHGTTLEDLHADLHHLATGLDREFWQASSRILEWL